MLICRYTIFHVLLTFHKQTARRKMHFKTMFADTPTPPQPIHTRWGTWLDAAIYYATHIEKIAQFLDQCDPEEAQSIENAQNAISKPNIKKDLAFIKCDFECLSTTITNIQSRGALLADTIKMFDSIRSNLKSISKHKEFLNKMDLVEKKNRIGYFLKYRTSVEW